MIFKFRPIFSLTLVLLLVSCFGNSGHEDNPFVGTWKNTNYSSGDWEKYIFNDDMSFSLTSYNSETRTQSVLEGDYDYNGNQLELIFTTLTNTTLYEFDENKLYIAFGDTWFVYYKQ